MNFLEQEITVTQIDLDDLNHVNNVIYVKWIQEIAKNHWRNLVSNEILNNYYWVLLEHQIQYHHPAFLDEKIKIITYVDKTEGVKSSRVVEIFNKKTNQLLVTSKTIWCLINANTNKPNRINEEIKKAFS